MTDQWRDISSAPKDGTHILVCEARPPYDNSWTFAQRPPTVAHWFEDQDGGAFYLSVTHTEQPPVKPTHWMPLPPEPVGSIYR
jgi:hypothetical protein